MMVKWLTRVVRGEDHEAEIRRLLRVEESLHEQLDYAHSEMRAHYERGYRDGCDHLREQLAMVANAEPRLTVRRFVERSVTN